MAHVKCYFFTMEESHYEKKKYNLLQHVNYGCDVVTVYMEGPVSLISLIEIGRVDLAVIQIFPMVMLHSAL